MAVMAVMVHWVGAVGVGRGSSSSSTSGGGHRNYEISGSAPRFYFGRYDFDLTW